MEKLSKKIVAVEWLKKQAPDNKILKWCQKIFESKQPLMADENDAGVRLLEQLIEIK